MRNAEAEAEAVRNYRRNYHCMGRIEGWTVGYHSHYRDYQLWKELMCLFDTFDWEEG